MNNPVIVVPCFEKINSLKRLVKSLLNAKFFDSVTLFFSVDFSKNKEVLKYVNSICWPHGEKIIFQHEYNIGLRENILFCGSLTHRYGSVIILEDDAYVSRYFYEYARSAMVFYENCQDVAGISLYAYEYGEILKEKFHPLISGYDTFFMQWASSWGQLWTLNHWSGFIQWYEDNKDSSLSRFNIPDYVISWPKSSWKKYFIAYLVDKNKFFVYPYESLVTNCGDSGVHRDGDFVTDVQVPLPHYSNFKNYNFAEYDELISVKYDCFFQPMASIFYNSKLFNKFKFDTDFSGSKKNKNILNSHVLTSKKCKNHVCSFSDVLLPFELNIILNIKGDVFHLCRKEDVFFDDVSIFEKANRIIKNREILYSTKLLVVLLVYFRQLIKRKVGKFFRR